MTIQHTSVFQPGFRGTLEFCQFFTEFPVNSIFVVIFKMFGDAKWSIMIQMFRDLKKKVEKHCLSRLLEYDNLL